MLHATWEWETTDATVSSRQLSPEKKALRVTSVTSSYQFRLPSLSMFGPAQSYQRTNIRRRIKRVSRFWIGRSLYDRMNPPNSPIFTIGLMTRSHYGPQPTKMHGKLVRRRMIRPPYNYSFIFDLSGLASVSHHRRIW